MRVFHKIVSWIVTLLIPVALTFLGLRILLTHAFPEIEYRLPGFPKDDYGFNLADRLRWSKVSIDYLVNNSGISFLADRKFADGSALFNERELSHMQDVKNVVRPALWVGYGIWAFLLGLGLWAWFGGWRVEFLQGVRRGGGLLAAIVVVIGVFASVSFWQFFSLFHGLFFASGTWQFFFSDTLIRLFPMRFWQDAFLFVGLLDLAAGLLVGWLVKPKR
jgi:integral membrane protein (TIGR01906 family)